MVAEPVYESSFDFELFAKVILFQVCEIVLSVPEDLYSPEEASAYEKTTQFRKQTIKFAS